MTTRISGKKRKAVKSFISLYPTFKEEVEEFERREEENRLNETDLATFFKKKYYIESIESTFAATVNEHNREKVWKYVFEGKEVEAYEEMLIKNEVDRWFKCFAATIGI